MREGILVNGAHSYYTHKLNTVSRKIGAAPRDDLTERVPYSNVTHDFSELFGGHTYGDRKLSYTFEFICFDKHRAQERLKLIFDWLHWSGRKTLCDALLPDYHYESAEPTVSWSESHGIYKITAEFKASPAIVPNPNKLYNPSVYVFPDVNGDGKVDSIDASAIMTAYSNISAGKPSGLTEEQEALADADMNGVIDSRDASLILTFYSDVLSGKYENSPSGWAEFMHKQNIEKEAIY